MSFNRIGETLSFIDHNHTTHIYELLTNPTNKQSGTSIWAFASKKASSDEFEFFIKRYLTPKGPSSICDENETKRRDKACQDFISWKKSVFTKIDLTNSPYLLKPIHFFFIENSFHITYPKLNAIPFDFNLPFNQKIDIFIKIVEAILELHRNDVVHADIKMNNIIFEKNQKGEIIPYVIDLDSAYISGYPNDEIITDVLYQSPETKLYNEKDPTIKKTDLTTKSDIFSLGVLLYYMLFQRMPNVSSGTTLEFPIDYTSLNLTKIQKLKLDELFKGMFAPFSTRITAYEILNKLIYLYTKQFKLSQADYHKLTTNPSISEADSTLIKDCFLKKNTYYILIPAKSLSLKEVLKIYQVKFLKNKIDLSNIVKPAKNTEISNDGINFNHIKIEIFNHVHPTQKNNKTEIKTEEKSLLKGKLLNKIKHDVKK
jgi:serine/threonine protein kinase